MDHMEYGIHLITNPHSLHVDPTKYFANVHIDSVTVSRSNRKKIETRFGYLGEKKCICVFDYLFKSTFFPLSMHPRSRVEYTT